MRKICYAAAFLGLFLIGCNISDLDFKNIKLENLGSDIAVPFGTATYTVRELLDDASDSELNLEEDVETGELRLIYTQNASYTFSPDIFNVENLSNPSTISLPTTVANPGPGDLLVPLSGSFFQVYESEDNEIIDSVFHAAGSQLNVSLVTTNANIDITYSLTFENTVDVGTSNPVILNGVVGTTPDHMYNLENHKTVLTEFLGENRFNVLFDLDITLEAGESISATDEVTVSIEFANQDFIVVFGKLGQDTVNVSNQTISVDFFDGLELDGLEFGNAEIRFDFRSSFGIPIAMGFEGIYGEDADANQTFLRGSIVNSPPEIASSPTDHPVTGEVTQTLITINSNNSNLEDILANSPTTIGFDIQGFTNAYDPSALNFVTDTSAIRSYMELELPMEVSMRDVVKEIDFNIGGGFSFKELDSMALRLVTVNGLPFAATMDMFIMNNDGDTLFQVLENEALDQPFLNIDRTVREPKTNIEDIPIGVKGVDALSNGDFIRLVLTMNSPESQTSEDIYVKLLADAELEVTLGARAIIDAKL